MQIRLFYLLSLLIITAANCSAQTWFEEDHVWVYRYFAPFNDHGFIETKVIGDTIISGLDCKILFSRTDIGSNEFMNSEYVYELDNAVYILDGEGREQKLYDFSLEVGDSITYEIVHSENADCPDSISYHIDSLSTIVLGAEELVVQHLSFYDPFWEEEVERTFVEYVGCLETEFDLLKWHTCAYDLPGGWMCSFSNVDSEIKFIDRDCYSFTISTHETLEEAFRIYPNPVRSGSQLNIELPEGMEDADITILDLYGRLVNSSVADQKGGSLSLSGVNAGNYIILIEKGDVSLRRKVMVVQ